VTYEYQDYYQRLMPKEREQVRCPVCKSLLGYRYPKQPFVEYCDDCRATYTWEPDTTLPRALLDVIKKSKQCGCSGCKARGEKDDSDN
jgi:ribosomal protein L37AE/L43A